MNRHAAAAPSMKIGLWVWPADQRAQQRILKTVAESEHLMAALQALARSKEGLSNAEIDDVLTDNSNWITRWVVEQLVSLGFTDYKVDFFGGPGRYKLTELGANALSAITGKPVQLQPQTPTPATKPAAPAPAPVPAPVAKPATPPATITK
jgi:hypothetical protein